MLSALSPVSAPEEHSCHNTNGKGGGRRESRALGAVPGASGSVAATVGGNANNPEQQSGGTRTRRLAAHSRGSSYALRIAQKSCTHTYLHIKHSAFMHTQSMQPGTQHTHMCLIKH